MMRTITVELDSPAAEHIERAAQTRDQLPGAFLAEVGEQAAHRILLDEAIARFEEDPDNVSLSELAGELGLWTEEIMQEIWRRDQAEAAGTGRTVEEVVRSRYRGSDEIAEEMFLAGCKSVADHSNDPDLMRPAQEAVAARRAKRQGDDPS